MQEGREGHPRGAGGRVGQRFPPSALPAVSSARQRWGALIEEDARAAQRRGGAAAARASALPDETAAHTHPHACPRARLCALARDDGRAGGGGARQG